jgi:hypothetical protein
MQNTVPPPTLSSSPAVNHVTLFEAFLAAFSLDLESMRWPKADQPILVQSYPKAREGAFDSKFDVILYHLVHSEVASTSNGAVRKPKGYWGYDRIKHPTKHGYVLVQATWQEAVTVQFTVLAKSNERANELVDWFHRMVLRYAHGMKFFQARGINYLTFEQRLEDATTKEYGQELYVRPLQYSLRLELMDVGEEKLLDNVAISVNGEIQ